MTVPEADTICAIATAPGQGAIGIIRLSGPQAEPLLRTACEGKKLRPRRLSLVRVSDPRSGELLDQALACLMPGPRSFSGEDMAELSAHGGSLNLQRLLRLFVELGARPAEPGEFTRRAFRNGRIDLSQAEAVAAVIGARSERALSNAQALLVGGLGQRLAPLQQALLEMTALVEASIDFVEELAAPFNRQELLEHSKAVASQLATLAQSYAKGRRLQGARVGIIGAVNAGKSTLFNRLLGVSRALVSAEPGTTRDYLEAEAIWDGQRVQLVDVAGWRDSVEQSSLERAGAALAETVLKSCEMLLEVVDLTAPVVSSRPAWLESTGLPLLRVGNKLDLLVDAERQQLQAEHPALVTVSALSGEGMAELRSLLLEKLFGTSTEESFFITEERQWHALHRAGEAMAEAEQAIQQELAPELIVEHLGEARRLVGSISGEVSTEAVLDEIFRRFCIGK